MKVDRFPFNNQESLHDILEMYISLYEGCEYSYSNNDSCLSILCKGTFVYISTGTIMDGVNTYLLVTTKDETELVYDDCYDYHLMIRSRSVSGIQSRTKAILNRYILK